MFICLSQFYQLLAVSISVLLLLLLRMPIRLFWITKIETADLYNYLSIHYFLFFLKKTAKLNINRQYLHQESRTILRYRWKRELLLILEKLFRGEKASQVNYLPYTGTQEDNDGQYTEPLYSGGSHFDSVFHRHLLGLLTQTW